MSFVCLSVIGYAQTKKHIKKKSTTSTKVPAIKPEVIPEPPKAPAYRNVPNVKPDPHIETVAPKQIHITQVDGKNISVYTIAEIADVDFKSIKTFSINSRYVPNISQNTLNDLIIKLFNEGSQLEVLELKYSKLITLPAITKANTNLKKLVLVNNNLTDLPTGIEKLVNLEELNLDNNSFSTLPNSLTQLKKLKVISLGKNDFKIFPSQLFEIPSLNQIYLHDSEISELPNSFNKLPNLTDVAFQSTKIANLPSSFGSLLKLKSITLDNNQFKDYPASLLPLTKLINVNLSNNPIDKTLFMKTISGIKWRGLFALYSINFTEKDYKTVETKLKLIDVYY